MNAPTVFHNDVSSLINATQEVSDAKAEALAGARARGVRLPGRQTTERLDTARDAYTVALAAVLAWHPIEVFSPDDA